MFLRAARHGELDLMTGVSSNVMVGQEGYYGTGCFQVLLNLNNMTNLQEKILDENEDIDSVLKIDDVNDPCSKQVITIDSNIDSEIPNNTGIVPTDYSIDF